MVRRLAHTVLLNGPDRYGPQVKTQWSESLNTGDTVGTPWTVQDDISPHKLFQCTNTITVCLNYINSQKWK
ncbi:hypothetical protein EYF80_049964 [Liparis tanakae]|uniref:Uncharacterized protein n=1 Tax=Liparis tanakae TaxID=230148 RepID=A0A4Z2FGK4_9TELE|nr:hypothetical protein EYF80_049964 [Liparis tanakae]